MQCKKYGGSGWGVAGVGVLVGCAYDDPPSMAAHVSHSVMPATTLEFQAEDVLVPGAPPITTPQTATPSR